jgi:excisionase family DNA binding protein
MVEYNLKTVEEAAIVLRCQKLKVYSLVKKRTIPHVRIGGRILIPERSLMDWVEQQAKNSLEG